MIFAIPIDVSTKTPDGEISFAVELDGLTYQLELSYSIAAQLWYLSLFLQVDTTITPIAQGIAFVVGVPLLADVQVEDRPAGEFMLAGAADPGREDIGKASTLYYYDAEELEAL